jgi:hypothetical protein
MAEDRAKGADMLTDEQRQTIEAEEQLRHG